jgi:hypothetical protein
MNNKNDAAILRKILLPDNYIKLDKNLVRVLGIKHAGFLSILIDFDKYISSRRLYIERADGQWFYLSVEEADNRYLLTKDEQQKLCNDLSLLGLIEFKIFGIPRRKHFKLNYTYILELVNMDNEQLDEIKLCKFMPIIRKKSTSIGGLLPPMLEGFNRQPIHNKEIKDKNYNIPLEEKIELFSLLTSNQPMYESKKQNIDANCTIPVNDITIPVLKDKPKKVKSNFQSNPEKYLWINAKFKEWNDNSPTDIQIKKPSKSDGGSFHVLGVVYEKFGEEKATAFFDYIMSKGNYRNPFSLSSLKNHEEFNNFYQDPEEEQPKYLDTNKGKETARFKTSQTEPVAGDFFQGDNFYAAMENYWSQSLNGTSLVKKVRERIIQINSKYKNY